MQQHVQEMRFLSRLRKGRAPKRNRTYKYAGLIGSPLLVTLFSCAFVCLVAFGVFTGGMVGGDVGAVMKKAFSSRCLFGDAAGFFAAAEHE